MEHQETLVFHQHLCERDTADNTTRERHISSPEEPMTTACLLISIKSHFHGPIRSSSTLRYFQSMEEVKLLGKWPCPYVLRARVALQLKRVEYEYLEEELGGKSELLLKSNPVLKKIPVLIHRGRPLCESLIIVQYIDEAWPAAPTLLPAGANDRAVHRFWAAYFDDKWSPLLTRLRNGEQGRAKEEAAEGVQLLEEAFVTLSQGKGFFGGNKIGYLDIAIGCHLGWIRVTESLIGLKLIEEAKVPALAGWAERFCAHEAVQGMMPETERLMEIFQLAQAVKKPSGLEVQ